MKSIPQVCSVICGLALLILFHATQTSAVMLAEVGTNANQSDRKLSDVTGSRTIKGAVMRIEYGDYFVKEKDGKEVRVHTDKTTQMMGQLKQGDRVEVEVTGQNHALRIRSLP